MTTQITVFYDDLVDLTQRFSTENHKKEMWEKEGTQEKPSELTAGREKRDLNTTEQMETSAHDWKESKISFHAGVRGGNKDW